jgi:AmpD protein
MRTISFVDKFFLDFETCDEADMPRKNESFDDVRSIMSPNCDERPANTVIDTLVIHNISLPSGVFEGDDVIKLFTNTLDTSAHPAYQPLEGLRVSSHFFIRRDGEVTQFVPCELRAWHAGQSLWRGRTAVNNFSIGIEMEGSDATFFTEKQYRALATLTVRLISAYPVVDIVGHSDIAPTRKTDPGACFDLENYHYISAGLIPNSEQA